MTDEPQQGYAQESAPLQSQRSAVSTTTLSISEDDVEEATYIQTPQRVSIPEGTPATPLLQADKVTATPERWPTSQQKVLKSKFEISWDGFFDFALFISAVAFLAFAAFVSYYDQAPTAAKPKATKMLLNATKYICGNAI